MHRRENPCANAEGWSLFLFSPWPYLEIALDQYGSANRLELIINALIGWKYRHSILETNETSELGEAPSRASTSAQRLRWRASHPGASNAKWEESAKTRRFTIEGPH